MRIGHPLGQDHQDGITAAVGGPPHRLAMRVEEDAPVLDVAACEPRRARKLLVARRISRLGLATREFLGGDTAAQPRPAARRLGDQLIVQLLEQTGHDVVLGPPAAAQDPAIDAAQHVAKDVRLHVRQLRRGCA